MCRWIWLYIFSFFAGSSAFLTRSRQCGCFCFWWLSSMMGIVYRISIITCVLSVAYGQFNIIAAFALLWLILLYLVQSASACFADVCKSHRMCEAQCGQRGCEAICPDICWATYIVNAWLCIEVHVAGYNHMLQFLIACSGLCSGVIIQFCFGHSFKKK